MKCFFHQDRDAVGICKSCGRGICAECRVDLEKGLACRGRCEEEVKRIIAAVQSNVRTAIGAETLLRQTRSGTLYVAIAYFAVGAIFVAWGLTSSGPFIILLGVVPCLLGVINLIKGL